MEHSKGNLDPKPCEDGASHRTNLETERFPSLRIGLPQVAGRQEASGSASERGQGIIDRPLEGSRKHHRCDGISPEDHDPTTCTTVWHHLLATTTLLHLLAGSFAKRRSWLKLSPIYCGCPENIWFVRSVSLYKRCYRISSSNSATMKTDRHLSMCLEFDWINWWKLGKRLVYQHLWLKIHHFTKRKVIFSQTPWNNNDLGFWCSALVARVTWFCIHLPSIGRGHLVKNQLFGPVAGVFLHLFFCGGVVFGILKMLPLFTNS